MLGILRVGVENEIYSRDVMTRTCTNDQTDKKCKRRVALLVAIDLCNGPV